MLAFQLAFADQISLEQAAVTSVTHPGWSDDIDDAVLKNQLDKIPALKLNEGQQVVSSNGKRHCD
jgi:hypothetical protein